MKKLDICKHCGETKVWHCNFEAIEVPDNCVCNPKEWGNLGNIPPVCGEFKPISLDEPELCATCEHEKECHK